MQCTRAYIYIALCVGIISHTLSVYATNAYSAPEVVVRPQTQEEAFSYLWHRLQQLSFYKENGYTFTLPSHPAFRKLWKDPRPLTDDDQKKLRHLFDQEYGVDIQAALQKIETVKPDIRKIVQRLRLLQINWGFQIFPKYEVLFTQYGPGGSYNPIQAQVILLVTKEGAFGFDPLRTIIHEIIHIGIEEIIVQQYRLTHREKEHIVDLICSLYLPDIFPGELQTKASNDIQRMDNVVTRQMIIKNLPLAIQQYRVQ